MFKDVQGKYMKVPQVLTNFVSASQGFREGQNPHWIHQPEATCAAEPEALQQLKATRPVTGLLTTASDQTDRRAVGHGTHAWLLPVQTMIYKWLVSMGFYYTTNIN